MKNLAIMLMPWAMAAVLVGCGSGPNSSDAQSFTDYIRDSDVGALDKVWGEDVTDERLLEHGEWLCGRFHEDGVQEYYSREIVPPSNMFGMTPEESVTYHTSLMRGASTWLCPEYADGVDTVLGG